MKIKDLLNLNSVDINNLTDVELRNVVTQSAQSVNARMNRVKNANLQGKSTAYDKYVQRGKIGNINNMTRTELHSTLQSNINILTDSSSTISGIKKTEKYFKDKKILNESKTKTTKSSNTKTTKSSKTKTKTSKNGYDEKIRHKEEFTEFYEDVIKNLSDRDSTRFWKEYKKFKEGKNAKELLGDTNKLIRGFYDIMFKQGHYVKNADVQQQAQSYFDELYEEINQREFEEFKDVFK